MENKFKDNLWQIISVILAASLILSIVKMNDLSEQMTTLQNKYTLTADSVKSELQSLYGRIDELIKEQSNVILSYDCKLGDFNAEDKTVPMKITVVPKTFGESTAVKIKFGDVTTDASKNDDNEFFADFTVNLFDEATTATVYVINNGETTAQNINVISEYLYKKYIPTANGSFSGTSSYSSFGGKLSIKGTVSVYIENTEYSSIQSCKLSVKINDNETESKSVDITEGNTSVEFNNSYIIGKNDLFEIWLISTDSFGYEHRAYVYGVTENDDNTQAEIVMTDAEYIFDSDGNAILPKTER